MEGGTLVVSLWMISTPCFTRPHATAATALRPDHSQLHPYSRTASHNPSTGADAGRVRSQVRRRVCAARIPCLPAGLTKKHRVVSSPLQQVLPLSLSVDFLGLVLAVVDDHARSQGQGNTATVAASAGSTATKPSALDNAFSPEKSPPADSISAAGTGSLGEDGVGPEGTAMVGAEGGGVAAPAPAHATAIRFLSLGDLPRLYNRPGAIIRNLAKACKGDAPSGEVGDGELFFLLVLFFTFFVSSL